MKKLILVVTFSIASLMAQYSIAAPAWYAGKVNRVALNGGGGSFLVTFSNGALDDCEYKYAYFYLAKLGELKLKNAYAMALTSLTTKIDMGIVIDKAINGPGGQCDATGMTADLRSN